MSSPPRNLQESDGTANIEYPADGLQALQAATNQMDHQHDPALTPQTTEQNRDVTPTQQYMLQTSAYAHHAALATNMASPGPIVSDPDALARIAAEASQDAFETTVAPTASIPGAVSIAQAPLMPQAMAPDMPHLDQHGHAMRDPSQNPKLTRLSRACDNCSARKVKCSETLPCKACLEHNIECTNDRAVKRRGPPNKSVLMIKNKKARLSSDDGATPAMESGPSPPTTFGTNSHTAAAALVSIAGTESGSGRAVDAEAIAPLSILKMLVDDFFTYIYPLCPFPHKALFQLRFGERKDRTNPEFLALLSSMIAALVASFPRSAEPILHHQKPVAVVQRCMAIARDVHGSNKRQDTVEDAATSFFLGLAAGYTEQRAEFERWMADAWSILCRIGRYTPLPSHLNPPSHLGLTFGYDMSSPDQLRFSHISDEIGKRIWLSLYCSAR
jgi:hypothetical protein